MKPGKSPYGRQDAPTPYLPTPPETQTAKKLDSLLAKLLSPNKPLSPKQARELQGIGDALANESDLSREALLDRLAADLDQLSQYQP